MVSARPQRVIVAICHNCTRGQAYCFALVLRSPTATTTSKDHEQRNKAQIPTARQYTEDHLIRVTQVWNGPIRGDVGVRSGSVCSRSGSSVGVSGGDAAFPQSVQHGGRVNAQLFADPRQ
jgi:hypothetical protein